MGFMAILIPRRLPRVVFQAAALSTSKWAWHNPPVDELGRRYLFKSANAPARSEDDHRNRLGHRESPVAYKTATFPAEINDYEKGIEENDVYSFDNDCPSLVSKPPTKAYATISQFLPKDKQIGLSLDQRKPARVTFKKMSEASDYRLYGDIESYDTRQDPRAFQQHRPEYKSMCYNSERLMETSMEEGDRILEKVTSRLTPSEVSDFLEKLSYLPEKMLLAIKSDERFRTLCSCSTSNLPFYTNSEIISILGAFVRLGIAPCPMLKQYEQELCLRVRQLSTNELLLVADTFRYIGVHFPEYLNLTYSCMQLSCSDLSLPQLIQLIYIIGEGRHAPKELLEKIEPMVLRYIKSINLEEIGTVCLGFFKTGNGLSLHLTEKFGDIIVENIEQVTNFSLVSVLKMFRFTRAFHMQFFRQVGEEASKRVPKMTMQGIMHVVLAFASMRNLNEDLMNAVALAIPSRLSYCRSKDLAKFLWSFGMLGYKPPNADVFYAAFIKQIHKNLKEFMKYPEHFLTCLMGLVFCQQYPLDLISIALSEKFVMRSAKVRAFELKKDLFTIAGSVEIECPQYTGDTISPEFRKEVTGMIVELSTRDIHKREEWIEAGMLLQHILGGPQYVKEHMILPHTRSKDFEVHLDVNGKPVAVNTVVEELDPPLIKHCNVKITDDLISQLTNTAKRIPTSSKSRPVTNPEDPNTVRDLSKATLPEKAENPAGQSVVIKLAIQVTNRNQYLSNCFTEPTALYVLKRRQLRKLGYVVVDVPYWEWFPLAKQTQSEKMAYLHQKVFGSVEVK
ncbi:PREDICTED: FAST kinase domain-containing protein 5, mitochondrial [Nanorana parkeri]|uniref:FAST kinase domain-containing protein 5, mitochondrial n=1 Tax=Nanorana parkeri TaxID=125878 RepID=UPI0008550391|nr:PREDICTED: FAST kinase domain-containing protein 5, mitochondrial [Nanorana parkeri]